MAHLDPPAHLDPLVDAASLESGPAFLRCEERAHWLADEHGLTHGYASAIVHEYEVRRRTRLNSF